MAIERVLMSEQSDGEELGNGVYRIWLTIDRRPSGAEFILFAEVDNTLRPQTTRYKMYAQGVGTWEGTVPPGGTRRIPDTGELQGFRIDGGRDYTVSLG